MSLQSTLDGQRDAPPMAGRPRPPQGQINGRDGSPRPLLVEIEARNERVGLRVDRKGPTLLDGSESAETDLAIRFREHSLEDVLLRWGDSLAALRDAEVADGDGWTAPLPAAEAQMLTGAEFDLIPGASLVAALRVTETVCGDVVLVEHWRDGQLIESETVSPDRFDAIRAQLRITFTLSQLTALRRREITPADALAAGARLETVWPYMACYFGLIQQVAYAEAYANVATADAQVAWGRLLSDAAYREAVVEAMQSRSAA